MTCDDQRFNNCFFDSHYIFYFLEIYFYDKQIMMSWTEIFRQINWNLTEPLSTAKINGTGNLSINEIMNTEIPIKKGDKIQILRKCCDNCSKKCKCITILSEPIVGKKTAKNILKALERGLNKNIIPGDRRRNNKNDKKKYSQYKLENNIEKNSTIYHFIGQWFDTSARIHFVGLYEKGELKPRDLLGDHRYFEGISKKGDIFIYHTGS
jgi:hypothetical protein